MDFACRVLEVFDETNGVSKAGKPWKKKEWLVETFDQYPRKVKVQCFGDRADSINLERGKDYTIFVDLESREYNGRWYTDVNVYRYQEYQGQPNPAGQTPSYQGGYSGQQSQGGFNNAPYATQGAPAFGGGASEPFAPQSDDSDEDLPF